MEIEGKVMDNPFSFGGGLVNGGLSSEAMKLLRNIFSFDYMGSAEFEFGAVPEALQKIAKNNQQYVAFEIPNVTYKYKTWKKSNPVLTGKRPVYVICFDTDKVEVEQRIRIKAKHEYGTKDENFNTKERVMLDRALANGEGNDVFGWLELDNGYFFFIDKQMYEGVAKLFGIKIQ